MVSSAYPVRESDFCRESVFFNILNLIEYPFLMPLLALSVDGVDEKLEVKPWNSKKYVRFYCESVTATSVQEEFARATGRKNNLRNSGSQRGLTF